MSNTNYFDQPDVAERYQRKGGFAAERKQKLLSVCCDLLVALAPPQATVLELGAGAGHFTRQLLAAGHFGHILATDGAPEMMRHAQETLPADGVTLQLLDFATEWTAVFGPNRFDAVTSTMALHHAVEKRQLFAQIYDVLKPGGVFVLGDHMGGATPLTDSLLVRERAWIKMGRDKPVPADKLAEEMKAVVKRSRMEGNQCESVAAYEAQMSACGFVDVECLWRDYWLAAFVARKPASSDL